MSIGNAIAEFCCPANDDCYFPDTAQCAGGIWMLGTNYVPCTGYLPSPPPPDFMPRPPPAPAPPPAPPPGTCVISFNECDPGNLTHPGVPCCDAAESCFTQHALYSQCLTACPNNPAWECYQSPPSTPPAPPAAPACDSVIELALVLDVSGSLSGNIGELKAFAHAIVNQFVISPTNARISITRFNDAPQVLEVLTDNEVRA